jgi:integrase
MSMNATTSLFHDLRYKNKDKRHPIKLCVIFQRKNKLYKTGVNATKDEWSKINSQRPRGDLKEDRIKCDLVLKKADGIIKDLREFSFTAFEKHFSGNNFSNNVYISFKSYADKLIKEGRISTASSYNCSLNSLRQFKTSLQFYEITTDFLQNYEAWMLKKGASITTVGIYLRSLRTLVNQAIAEGIIKLDLYPFGKRKYQIPTGRNIKKALPLVEIKKIFDYETVKNDSEDKAKDFWIFTYLCNGLNVKDIARLKWKNIRDDKLIFTRAKTERAIRSNPKQVVVILSKEAKTIIKKWCNKDKGSENFIFPILCKDISPTEEYKLIYNFTRHINKWLKRMGKDLGFEMNLTTYTARHSFSTVLKRSGAPVAFISEALGHGNTATTQNYLDSFEDSVKKDFASKLTAFAKTPVKKKKQK